MKLFELRRTEDETGISGTGTVAQGVIFDNGWCALTWLTEHTSAAFYTSIDEVVAIHGHGGKTRVVQIVDCDMATSRKLCTSVAMDHMESVAVEFTTPNHQSCWNERDALADMFRELAIDGLGWPIPRSG